MEKPWSRSGSGGSLGDASDPVTLPADSELSEDPPRRERQARTVYTQAQRQELLSFFEKNQYPDYQQRKALADRLSLGEHKVQVWFKNRRAKHSRLQRQQGGEQQQKGLPGRRRRGSLNLGPAAPESPAFPEGGTGFCTPSPQGGPSAIFPSTEPAGSSPGQVCQIPAHNAQGYALAPALARAQGPCSAAFSPDPESYSDYSGILSYQSPYGRPSVMPSTSGYQARAGFASWNHEDNIDLLSS